MGTALSKKLTKFAKSKGFGDSMKDSKFGKISDYLPIKSIMINLMLSAKIKGGVPVGKSVMLAGPTSSGKTLLALSAIKAAQDKGYTVVYWDSEYAGEQGIFNSFNIGLEDVIHMPIAELSTIRTAFVNLCKEIEEGDKVFHVFDSMGAWITDKTLDDADSGNNAKDMTIPGSKKSLMTIINGECGKKHMGVTIINHSYANVGGYGAATTVAGGGALYMPSVILEFTSKAKWKDGTAAGEQIGNIFTGIIKKSRLSKESKKDKFGISNKHGISQYFGLMDHAIEGGFVRKTRDGKALAYQREYEIATLGEDKASKFKDKDWETLYFSPDFFEDLFANTTFEEYLQKEFSYGI